MNEEYLNYEESKELEKLGFDAFTTDVWLSPSNHKVQHGMMNYPKAIFRDVVSAPLYQQAFRWFREKYNRLHTVNIDLSNNLKDKVFVYTIEDHLRSIIDRSEEYTTYEEAELACLIKLIEFVKLSNHDKRNNKKVYDN